MKPGKANTIKGIFKWILEHFWLPLIVAVIAGVIILRITPTIAEDSPEHSEEPVFVSSELPTGEPLTVPAPSSTASLPSANTGTSTDIPASSTPSEPTMAVPISPTQDNNNPTESVVLSIIVDSFSIFKDGFYYAAPEPDNWIISFDKGVSGSFHYSRHLTEQELANWSHGGIFLDVNMKEIAEEGNYPTFWSDEKGNFAMQFPKNLKSGTYVFRLFQVINDVVYSTDIVFDYVP